MSYKVGQFRKNTLGRYLNPLVMSERVIYTYPSDDISERQIYFKDIAFSMSNDFDYQKKYYVRIQVKRTNTNQTFSISLANLNREQQSQQFLKSFYVPAMRQSEINKTAIIEIVFYPIINFSDLIIRLNRTAQDYLIQNEDQSSGRVFEVVSTGCTCDEIINIIDSISNVNQFDKIGVQGPSGLLMCINGEEIRVGPSGIYETHNGYKINFMGFVVTDPDPNISYFILDYQY